MRDQVLYFMKKIALTCLCLLCLLTGCQWVDQVALQDVEVSKIRVEMGKGVLLELKADIDNGSSRYLSLAAVEGEIYTREGTVALVSLADTCRIAAHSQEAVLLPLQIHLSDPLLLLKIGLNLTPQVLEGLYIKGTADLQVARRADTKGRVHQIQLDEMLLTEAADRINLF